VNSENGSHSTVKETVKISALLFYYNYFSLSKKVFEESRQRGRVQPKEVSW
jgi:hypothetical protein